MATKTKDTLKELRQMSGEMLTTREGELRTELFKLRTGEATEKTKDTSKFKKIKRDIARIETLRRAEQMKNSKKA